MQEHDLNRRQALRLAATAAVGGAAMAGAQVAQAADAKRPLRFDDPIWNREIKARLDGSINPKTFVYGSVNGVVCGVRDNERVRELMKFEVLSAIRIVPQADGSYQRLCRELIFYRDLATGKLMDHWDNPYTGEKVRVVDVANDPFNYVISEWYPEPPNYGGLNKEKPPRKPFLLKWGFADENTVVLETDIHLFYPSALQPAKWPRESPGPMSRVSELFRFFMRREDLENPALDHIPHHGVWSRITPWLPWMLMDQAPGHITYLGNFAARRNLDLFPKDVVERVKERFPKYLTAPEKWEDPSLSSLENYARQQTPAAPRAK